MAAISLHIVVDGATPDQLDRAALYLCRINARMVNIAAGAQLDRGMQFVERVRTETPGIGVFWRHLEDTGIWTRLDPISWYDSRIAPRLEWAFRNRIIFVTDNESSGNDEEIKRYVEWQIKVMEQLHRAGLNAAVGRFATGNIKENQYALLKPMFDAMIPGDYFSPNEYHNAPSGSSAGHLNRYKLAWQAAGRNLPTTIGEFGMAVNYQSDKGYLSANISGGMAAEIGIKHFEDWYKPNDVTVFWYCVGGYSWPNFQINEELYQELEAYAAKDAPPMPLPSMPKPSNANDKHRMKATQDVELLTGPAAGYALKGVIHTGFEVDLYNMPATSDRGVYFKWADVRTGPLVGMGGWVRDDVNWQEVKKATSEVPPVETPVYRNNSDYLSKNFDALMAQYKGEYVAIVDCAVVAHGVNLELVLATSRQQFPQATPFVHHMIRIEDDPPPVITDSPPTSGTVNPVTPVVVNPPVETPVRYRMQIVTFKEVSLPPSVAKTLIEAGVSLEMIV